MKVQHTWLGLVCMLLFSANSLAQLRDTIGIAQEAIRCITLSQDQQLVVRPVSSMLSVDIELLAGDSCATAYGLQVGTDSVQLIRIVNEQPVDSTLWIVTIKVIDEVVNAVPDTFRLLTGDDRVLPLLNNDRWEGGLPVIRLLPSSQLRGDLILQADLSIRYISSSDECPLMEQFAYELCIGSLCDTANVMLFIDCPELNVFNAVSANRDGINDFFHIENIQYYPSATLYIYNTNGSLVFNTQQYRNNWDGRTDDGKQLAAGTYFYTLNYSQANESKSLHGYLELQY